MVALGRYTQYPLSMNLKKHINTFPRNERAAVRERIARAHRDAGYECSELSVRAWANGGRKHPPEYVRIAVTEKETGGAVTRQELRPDVYPPDEPEQPKVGVTS